MTDAALFAGLGVALACGFIVGLEREHSEGDSSEDIYAGVRTFPLIALFGGAAQIVAVQTGAWFMGVALAALAAWIGVSYWRSSGQGHLGLTSEVAGLVCFLCGALALQNHPGLAFAIALATTVLLAVKTHLHDLAQRISKEDTYATLKFLVCAFVLLPLLPDKTVTWQVPGALLPARLRDTGFVLDVVNAREVGWMIVLIAGIGFLGYVATSLLGTRKGLGLSAFLGGLVSSTAVTLSFSGRARSSPGLLNTAVVAILVASSTMYLRVLVEVGAVHASFLGAVLQPFVAMALVGAGACIVFYRRGTKETDDEQVSLKNPFMLSEAIKFGLLYAAVKLVAAAAQQLFGHAGLYASAVLAGTTDVDAITLSVSHMVADVGHPLEPTAGALTIFLATLSNTVVKAGLAWTLGGRAVGIRVAGAYGCMSAAGALVLWLGS